MKFNSHIDKEYMKSLLTNFTKATGLFIEAVDTDGKTFFTPEDTKICEFCSYIKSKPYGEKQCQMSYKKACKEAFRWGTTYFFRCHAGLVMWAVPIIDGDTNIGSIISGKVLLWKVDDIFLEELKENNNNNNFDFEIIVDKIKKLEVISVQKCEAAAQMLLLIMNYLVKENNNMFTEQKNKQSWRNKILKEMDKRKNDSEDKIFDYDTYLKREKRLLQYIRIGDKKKIINMLPIIFTDIEVLSGYNVLKIKIRCMELSSNISRAIIDAGVDSKISVNKNEEFYNTIVKCNSSDEIFLILNTMILELVDSIFIKTQNKQKSLIEEARLYISKNYSDSITIEDVAKSVNLSSSYLSHVFRDKLNCTVNSYITRVRIEKSIELMALRELSIQDISKKVGFNSQSYFTQVFKRYIGVSPISYRNRFR